MIDEEHSRTAFNMRLATPGMNYLRFSGILARPFKNFMERQLAYFEIVLQNEHKKNKHRQHLQMLSQKNRRK